MYSRKTDTSSTRIDYVFSNTKACVYFQYLTVEGLDHAVVIARYDIPHEVKKENIPHCRYFDGWVINKNLETDEVFLEQAKFIINSVYRDSKKGDRDPSFHWLKVKTSLIELAKTREMEIKKLKSDKLII